MTVREHDLGAIFDAHVGAEFDTQDVDATMATMTADPAVTHVPTIAGATGYRPLRDFYSSSFIGCWPHDTAVEQVSRTVGERQVVDELIMTFTHDCVIPAFLPDVSPTGRSVTLPVVVVMGFDDEARVDFERIYWDQASLLVQVGLLDRSVGPVTGSEQVDRIRSRDAGVNPFSTR
ncbi:MAG: nuclear transport factor 2 family protein [Acidimicrobiales bacterium]